MYSWAGQLYTALKTVYQEIKGISAGLTGFSGIKNAYIFLPTNYWENIFFAHELHGFSCKRVQNRTCSSYAERSRKCQRNLHELHVLCINGDLLGRTNHTNNAEYSNIAERSRKY